jgi:RNA polymerase sigma-70 factor (ECF subfamily)
MEYNVAAQIKVYVDDPSALEKVKEEIGKLSPKFREVIVLRDIQELSYEEISKIIKVPLGTVKSRVNRARLRLQEKLRFLLEKK